MEVLLITTRETGRWTIPRGWPIKGLPAHKVAEREAWEEAGVKGRAKKSVLGNYSYVKVLDDGQKVPAFVEVHWLDVEYTKKDFPECKERKLAWLPALEASLLVNEPELKKLFEKLSARSQATTAILLDKPIDG